MDWKIPPRIKVYEALGAIADGRVEIVSDSEARVRSSSGKKTYTVTFDKKARILSVNDNGSYWQGYLGYPAITYLMVKRLLPYREDLGQILAGMPWKEINQKYKNDFAKTEGYIYEKLGHREELEHYAAEVLEKLSELPLIKPDKLPKPPKGW